MKQKTFMEKLAEGIVNSRWVIVGIFIACMVMTVFSLSWVKVESDITVYLPDSAEAKTGLSLMNKFFTYGTTNVMIEGIDEQEAQEVADYLAGMDGVKSVVFDLTSEHYNQDTESALFNVTLDAESNSKQCAVISKEIKSDLSAYHPYIYAEMLTNIEDMLAVEMAKVLVWVVITVIVVLLFTSSTYGEILVLIITFIVAAVVNMSTNFILGTMSFISNIVAVVLQLALSVDYAIIYCNRYKEEHEHLPIKQAVIVSLSKAIPEIAASSLTTIAGLAAMCFMQFRLGYDMGISLIKAIICSLLTVFLFMPAMLMLFGRFMDKTKHRNFVPKVNFMGKFAHATRLIIPPLFIALCIVAYLGYTNVNFAYAETIIENHHKNESDIALEKIQENFGDDNLMVVIMPADSYEKELAFSQELAACDEVNRILGMAYVDAIDGYRLADSINYRQLMELADVDETTAKALFAYYAAGDSTRHTFADSMETYTAPLIDLFLTMHDVVEEGTVEITADQSAMIDDLYGQLQDARMQLECEDYHRMLVYLDLPQQGQDAFDFIDKVHVIGEQYWPEGVTLTGNAIASYDFNKTFDRDNMVVSILSLVLVMIILLFTFKSFGMPLLLVLVIQGSIWLNFALTAWSGRYVYFMVLLIVSSIQMGANIDYAIVVSSRFKEVRLDNVPPKDAIIETLNFAFPTIITSGSMMVVAGALISRGVSEAIIAGMGRHVSIGTAISLVFVNFALPQVLLLGEGFANATTLKSSGKFGLFLADKGKRRAAAAIILALASVTALVSAPMALSRADAQLEETTLVNDSLIGRAEDLLETAEQLSIAQQTYSDTKMDYAEEIMTEQIGSEQLLDGAAQIAEGQALLDDAKERWETGNAQYQAGLATYNAGVKEYEAAKALVAEGQAKYDAGLAQLDAAKEEYAAGQAALALIKPIYDLVMPSYNQYLADKAAYDAAVASGDTETAASLESKVAIAKAAYESQSLLTGKSVSQTIAEYQAAQQQLQDGAAQIADAEALLADAKVQLDDGYAQLAAGEEKLKAGKAQLNAAKGQLDDGAAQIKDGEDELADAKAQFAEGEQLLEDNKEKLRQNLDALDKYGDDEQKLKAGIETLLADSAVSDITDKNSTYSEICAAAIKSFRQQTSDLQKSTELARIIMIALLVSGICAMMALLIWLFVGAPLPAAVLTVWAALGSAVCAIIWKMECMRFGWLTYAAAMLMALFALICTDIMVKTYRKKRFAKQDTLTE